MLKEAVVSGPSMVFTWYHEVGMATIRDHQFAEPRTCKQILGYEANALYLSTMLREVPCENEKVTQYDDLAQAALHLRQRLKDWTWFRLAEVDVEIPLHLLPKLEQLSPFFFYEQVPEGPAPLHMQEYLTHKSRKRGDGRKLVGALSPEKMPVHAPASLVASLVCGPWGSDHGLLSNI